MSDIDEIALETVKAIGNIDPDKLKGGKTQAMAQAQCLVIGAIKQFSGAQGDAEPESIATDDDVERVAKMAGWDNRKYMTPPDYAEWCRRMREFVRLSATPQPEGDGWVKCHIETAAIALEALEFYARERFKGFGDDPEPYEHHLAQQAISELQELVPQPPQEGE